MPRLRSEALGVVLLLPCTRVVVLSQQFLMGKLAATAGVSAWSVASDPVRLSRCITGKTDQHALNYQYTDSSQPSTCYEWRGGVGKGQGREGERGASILPSFGAAVPPTTKEGGVAPGMDTARGKRVQPQVWLYFRQVPPMCTV